MFFVALTLCFSFNRFAALPDGWSDPIWVTFDSGGMSYDRKLGKILLANQYLPAERHRVINEALLDRLTPSVNVQNPEGFESTGGIAYFVDLTGAIVKFRFRTLAGREQFETFVQFLAKEYGEEAVIDRSENGDVVCVSNSKYVRKEPDGVEIRKIPWHLVYREGVCGWAGRSIRPEMLGGLAEIAAGSVKKDWVLIAAPGNVSPTHRAQFLSVIAMELGVQKQRADAEPEQDFAVRRAWIEQSEWFIQQAMSDIQQVTFWMDDPRDEEPSFRAHVKVDLVPESSRNRSRNPNALGSVKGILLASAHGRERQDHRGSSEAGGEVDSRDC